MQWTIYTHCILFFDFTLQGNRDNYLGQGQGCIIYQKPWNLSRLDYYLACFFLSGKHQCFKLHLSLRVNLGASFVGFYLVPKPFYRLSSRKAFHEWLCIWSHFQVLLTDFLFCSANSEDFYYCINDLFWAKVIIAPFNFNFIRLSTLVKGTLGKLYFLEVH